MHYALDIGTHSLKLVRFEPARRPRILGLAARSLPDEASLAAAGTRREALREFLKAEPAGRAKPIHVSFPAADTFVRYITLPHIPDRKVRRIMMFEAEQQIPFPIDDVIWDYALLPSGKGGKREAVLSALKREHADPTLAVLAEFGFSVRAVSSSAVSLYQLYERQFAPKEHTLIIHIEAQSTTLLMIHRHSFWSRGISQGGMKLASTAAAGQEREAADTPFFTDLAHEISRTVSFYHTQVSDRKFDRVLLTGGVSRTKGASEFFENNLDLPSSVWNPESLFDFSDTARPVFQKEYPTFLVALGLAASLNAPAGRPNIRMVASEVHRAADLGQKRVAYYLVGALTVLFLCLCVASLFFERSAKEKTLAAERVKLSYYRAEDAEENEVEARVFELDRKLKFLSEAVDQKSVPVSVLEEIIARTPQSIWFRRVTFDGVDKALVLEGSTYGALGDINQFAGQLEQSALFEKAEVTSAGIVGGDDKKEKTTAQETPVREKPSDASRVERVFSIRLTLGGGTHAVS